MNQCTTNSATGDARCDCHYRPNVDVCEKDNEVVIQADLPGATPDSIDVDFDDGTLTIAAKVAARHGGDTRFLAREYGTGDYRRTFRVSEVVDAEQIVADYAEGVLTLRLPKIQAAQPRKIAVHSN